MLEYNPGVRLIFVLLVLGAISSPLLGWFHRRQTRLDRTLKWACPVVSGGTMAATIAIFVIFGSAPFMHAGDKPPALIMTKPASANSIPDITLSFWTAKPSQNKISWGGEGRNESLKEPAASQRHSFTLNNLKPDSNYWYQLNDQAPVKFITPPADFPLRLAVASDPHYGAGNNRPDITNKIIRQIQGGGFDLFLHLGDLAQYGWKDTDWQEGMADLGGLSSKLPMRMPPGNHDTMLGGWDRYQQYWNPATPGPPWTRLDIGQVHLLLLDIEWLSEAMTPEQLSWLEKELAAIPREEWCIAAAHGFIYSSGTTENGTLIADNAELIRTVAPLFEKYDVDLMLSGHTHALEWLQAGGVDYLVCGAFGGIPDGPRTYVSPASRWQMNGAYSYLDINVDKSEITAVFRDTDGKPIYTVKIKP